VYYEFFKKVFGNAEEYVAILLKERYHILNHQSDQLEHNYIIEQTNDKISSTFEKVKCFNESSFVKYFSLVESKIDKSNQLTQEKIDELNPKHQNSAVKGNVGEFQVEEFLRNRLKHEYTIYNTSKTTASGDLIVEKNKKNSLCIPKVMIDVKNRSSSNVPKDEQEKFIRDLESRNIRVGILASALTGFACMNVLDCEVVDNGKRVVVYVGRFKENFETLEVAVRLAFVLDEIFEAYGKDKSIDEDFERIADQISKTFDLLKDFEKMKKSMGDALDVFKKRLNKELDMLRNICPLPLSDNRKRKSQIDHFYRQ
jgi:hypothetical protein